MERTIESVLLGARWLLLPLYVALLATVVAIYGLVGRELLHMAAGLGSATETELVLALLSVLDLVLIANLVVMVAISSYESFVSRIESADEARQPEWLGKMDSGNVKLKVSLSIVMISAIHLLRAFMRDTPSDRLMVMGGIHLVFVVSTLLIALVDRMHRQEH
ncbi:MAG: TIGR00645 family protein [Rhodospirillales bacterium 70-18]|nr:TIGR00645 family protein [Rhodospirillales bacterium]OJY63396.1 MAG: TIGR00645 family protein [Rhodospirillales bacterium 70-18]